MLKVALVIFAVCFSAMVASSPTAYLPIGADTHLQLQIHRLFAKTRGNPMRLPYAIKDIELALSEIEQTEPALYRSINDQLDRYRGRQKVSRLGITARQSAKEHQLIGNQRGLLSDEHLQATFEAIWRPNNVVLVQAGMDYRQNSSQLVPYNSFIALSRGKFQLDLGYREHWYSPFRFSSKLISSNAPLNPSISLSTNESIEKWWHLNFDLFYTHLDAVKQGIRYDDELHDGSPRLLGMHINLEPIDGWKLGFNRILQFGGGPRKVTLGNFLKAFVDPVSNDNSFTVEQRKTEFGDQLASITTSYAFDRYLPMEIYAELAAEDTQGQSNLSLGNQATSFGIFIPRINENITFRYEYNRFKTSWYTNHNYVFGNTDDGAVIGHYAGDQRKFGHGIPAEINKLSVNTFTSIDSSWGLSMGSINNKDKSLYKKGYEVELQHRQYLQSKRIESKLIYGESVFSKTYLHFSTAVFW